MNTNLYNHNKDIYKKERSKSPRCLSVSIGYLEVGSKELVKDGEIKLHLGEKYGFISRNGSGKSTILKLIDRTFNNQPLEDNIDFDGQIFISPDIKIGYLSQEPKFYFSGSVEEYLDFISERFSSIFKRYKELSSKNKERLTEEENQEYLIILDKMKRFDLWDYEEKRKEIIQRLGIDVNLLKRNLSEISGGEATRVALAGLFLSEVNYWLLDEPTNNLDFDGIKLLIEEIKGFKGGVLVVTHDRRILNEAVSKIYEIDEETKTIRCWGGNYDFYKKKKEEEFNARMRDYEEQEKKKKQLLDSLNKLKGQAHKFERISKNAFFKGKGAKLAKRAKTQEERIEKELERFTMPEPPSKPRFPKPTLEIIKGTVISAQHISYVTPHGKKLFEIDNLFLTRGEKLLIEGPNGSGKTTFLKIIIGLLEPTSGSINRNLGRFGYLPQIPEIKNPDIKSAYYLCEEYGINEDDVKKILNLMKIPDVFDMKIKDLSLGEIRRLQIAAILLKNPEVLILDEPTNHLDIYTVEELVEVLNEYKGTIIFVSHDQSFIEDLKPTKKIRLV